MDRREELKAKARDYERNDQPEHALEIYTAQVADSPLAVRGGIWYRIGDLHERIGGQANAAESFSNSATAFAEAGQINNAIAVTQRVLRLHPDDVRAQRRLFELSLAQGYRAFARSGVIDYARGVAGKGEPESAVALVAAFLGRFPDEAGVWKEWEQELSAQGGEGLVSAIFDRLHETLAQEGNSEAIERLSREASRVRSQRGRAGPDESFIPDEAQDTPSAADIPLLLGDQDPTSQNARSSVRQIEGLEPTIGGGHHTFNEAEGDENLPLLGNTPEVEDAPRRTGGAAEPVRRLPGVDRFGFEQDEWDPEVPHGSPAEGTAEGHSESPSAAPSSGWLDEAEEPARSSVEADEPGYDDIPLLSGMPTPEPSTAPFIDTREFFDTEAIAASLHRHAGIDVDSTDAASHYDLGLAYKEMERFEESVANLAMALKKGHDPAAVLEVVGEILVKRGDFAFADDLLRRTPGVGGDLVPEHLGVLYWLARAAEADGRPEEARRALQLIVSVDRDFRDAAARLEDPS